MAFKDLDKINKLDLSSISLSDVKDIKDQSLKKTLLEAIRRSTDVEGHQSHLSHGDHVTGPDNDIL